MYTDFLKKLSSKLIRHEFGIIGVYGDGDMISEKTNVMLMQKVSGSVFYIIGIIDGTKRDLESYSEETGKFIDSVSRRLDELNCTRLINLNIIAGGAQAKSFARGFDFNVEDKAVRVWWSVDIENNEIFVPEGQPDKVLNIHSLVNDALKQEAECDNSIAVNYKSYEQAVGQATALEHRSVNSGLTIFMVLVNALIFLGGIVSGQEGLLVNNFALNPSKIIIDGQWYRLVTAMFLHLSLAHIMSNALYLYLFGSRVEKYYGKRDFLIIYFVSGILGSILSLVFTRSISAGASGAIFGLMGAALALSQVQEKSVDGLSFHTMLILFVPGLIMGFLMPNVDVFGHIGGALGGYGLGYAIQKIRKVKDIESV